MNLFFLKTELFGVFFKIENYCHQIINTTINPQLARHNYSHIYILFYGFRESPKVDSVDDIDLKALYLHLCKIE